VKIDAERARALRTILLEARARVDLVLQAIGEDGEVDAEALAKLKATGGRLEESSFWPAFTSRTSSLPLQDGK